MAFFGFIALIGLLGAILVLLPIVLALTPGWVWWTLLVVAALPIVLPVIGLVCAGIMALFGMVFRRVE